MDGEGEAPRTAAVHRHVGLLHTPALQADLQRGAARSGVPPAQVSRGQQWSAAQPSTTMAFGSTMNKMGLRSTIYPNVPAASSHPRVGSAPLTLSAGGSLTPLSSGLPIPSHVPSGGISLHPTMKTSLLLSLVPVHSLYTSHDLHTLLCCLSPLTTTEVPEASTWPL